MATRRVSRVAKRVDTTYAPLETHLPIPGVLQALLPSTRLWHMLSRGCLSFVFSYSSCFFLFPMYISSTRLWHMLFRGCILSFVFFLILLVFFFSCVYFIYRILLCFLTIVHTVFISQHVNVLSHIKAMQNPEK